MGATGTHHAARMSGSLVCAFVGAQAVLVLWGLWKGQPKKKIDRTEQGETARLAEKPEVEAGVCAVRRVSSQARSLGNEERAGNCTQSFGAHFTYVDVVVLKIP